MLNVFICRIFASRMCLGRFYAKILRPKYFVFDHEEVVALYITPAILHVAERAGADR